MVAIKINIGSTSIKGNCLTACPARIDNAYAIGVIAPVYLLSLIHGIGRTTNLSIVFIDPAIDAIVLVHNDGYFTEVLLAHEVRGQSPLNIETIDGGEIV